MTDSYDLTKLGPQAFENIVNFLVLRTLGSGATGFGPGADGGRDGYFEGEAPYPSTKECWKGVWYIQSKFHAPHLSHNPQKWLVQQVEAEIEKFDTDQSDRSWPDNWIIATNIDQSGKPKTGSFDAIKRALKKSRGGRRVNLDVWGGRKILDLLATHPEVARYYGHLLTPGHVLAALYAELAESRSSVADIVRYFVASQFADHLFTKLDQAGSSADVRPAVHDLFVDLPFSVATKPSDISLLAQLCCSSAQCHRYSLRKAYPDSWGGWNRRISRARVALLKGGPGQGKSTVGQYLSQIHRARLIMDPDGPKVVDGIRAAAKAVEISAKRDGFWPSTPRIPIQIELKEFAHWYSQRGEAESRTVLAYLAEVVGKKVGSPVLVKTLKSALSKQAWIVIFDGLDEVPNDFKDLVSNEVVHFLNDVIVEIDADVLSFCTSRPQGYSGQFSGLDGPVIELMQLDAHRAMACAIPLLRFGRTEDESSKSISILEEAIRSPSVKELMTTPLQAHIMAVVVRDGGRPPERRWTLFNSFYLVMKKRESLKNFQNPRISRLLREEDRLLKSVHMRLGFVLHARAERSEGAQTTLKREEFRQLVRDVVVELVDHEIEETVAGVMEATTERLVLVNTPESGDEVRFDIRQLQEFFAAEFLYDGVDSIELATRIDVIGGDAHWREVTHFLLSALIENRRTADVAVAVQSLRKLNEGDEQRNAIYSRRMARACLLATRLLLEGVLDQDQRDRQHLKPLFDPLSGMLDLSTMRALVRLDRGRSRQWLTQVLLDDLTTSIPREYAAGLYVLGYLLPDDHRDVDVARVAFRNASVKLREMLFEAWSPGEEPEFADIRRRIENDLLPRRWVIGLAIRALNSDDWLDYKPTTIKKLIGLCRRTLDSFTEIATEIGVVPDVATAAARCLSQVQIKRTKATINCGICQATAFPQNWVNGKVPRHLVPIDAAAVVSKAGGICRLMLACVWFAQERSESSVQEIIRIIERVGPSRTECVPRSLLALVPTASGYAEKPFDVEHLRDLKYPLKKRDLELLAPRLGVPTLHLMIERQIPQPSDEDWRRLTLTLPMLAADLVFESEELPWRTPAVLVPELVSLLKRSPVLVASRILRWGCFKGHAPDLLQALKEAVRDVPVDCVEFRSDLYLPVLPFALDMPMDTPLLALLAPALVGGVKWSRHELRRYVRDDTKIVLRDLLPLYSLDSGTLRSIAVADRYQASVRAGALALYWLLEAEMLRVGEGSGRRWGLATERKLYMELISEQNSNWLTYALVHGVLMFAAEADGEAVSLITYLMDSSSDGGDGRDVTNELTRNWRERSTAPVSSKQLLERWLGYSFEIPQYMSVQNKAGVQT